MLAAGEGAVANLSNESHSSRVVNLMLPCQQRDTIAADRRARRLNTPVFKPQNTCEKVLGTRISQVNLRLNLVSHKRVEQFFSSAKRIGMIGANPSLHQKAAVMAAIKIKLLMGLRTMNTIIKSTLLSVAALAATFTGCAVQAQAQQPLAQDQVQPPQQVTTTQQHYVAPVIAPQPQNPYYFGFSIQLVANNYGGKTLRIVSVTPGSPAQQAGLEIGDEIRSVNGMGFLYARDSFDAVNMLSRFVSTTPVGGGPAPAATSTARAQLYVAPPAVQPIANMVVRNVRNGQDVSVIVRPTPRYNNGGPVTVMAAPAVTAVAP